MNEHPLRDITEREVETFATDGVVCLRGLFDNGWVERLRDAADACMASPGPLNVEIAKERRDRGRFFHDTFVWRYNDDCRDFVFCSPAAKIAARLWAPPGSTSSSTNGSSRSPERQRGRRGITT